MSDIYQDFEGLEPDGSNWRDFDDDDGIRLMPCAGELPDE